MDGMKWPSDQSNNVLLLFDTTLTLGSNLLLSAVRNAALPSDRTTANPDSIILYCVCLKDSEVSPSKDSVKHKHSWVIYR